MEVSYEGGQGPEEAEAPWMNGIDIVSILSRGSLVRIPTHLRAGSFKVRAAVDVLLHTSPDRKWGLPSLLYGGYILSFLEIKRLRYWVYYSSQYSTEVKKE
jgi:hypothetical protein